MVGAAGDRPTCPREGVAVAVVEGHHHPCSLPEVVVAVAAVEDHRHLRSPQEVEVGEGVQAGWYVGVEVEEEEVWAPTAPWTEGVVVGVGCSAEAEVRESACLVGVGEVETVVGAGLLGLEEGVLHG